MPIPEDRDDIIAQVRRLAAETGGLDVEHVELDSAFKEDLDFDSLEFTEFVLGLEEMFDLNIPDEAATEAKTVRDAVELIVAMRGAGNLTKPASLRAALSDAGGRAP
jgi:acyl carrier protein